jgi:predicted dehydrogenase
LPLSDDLMKKVNVGILGCGAIAPAYLGNLQSHFSGVVNVVACADTVSTSAQIRAAEFKLPRACSPQELLADAAIELIVNLTPTPAHHATSLSILQAGKHMFSEKPLALSRAQGRELLETAAARQLHIGGAADTFLGAGLQLCRRLIDEGKIGTPIAANAVITANFYSMERYHSVYRGALLDLGPYYLAALVALLGPITRVAGAAEIRFREKPYPTDSPEAGKTFPVDIPTSVTAALDFADGTVLSLLASHDVHSYFPRVEIFGTLGALTLNDANFYNKRVTLRTAAGEESWDAAPGFGEGGRGLGVAEMAMALRENRSPRASGAMMYHVLDAILAIHDSSKAHRHVKMASRVERPAPFSFDSCRIS